MRLSIELTFYDEDGNNFSFDLSKTQAEVVTKALGLEPAADGMNMWADKSLKQHVLPKLNWKKVNQ